jgi:Heparinase II/III-like protein/Heparinase II/III N-terminus
MTACALLSRDLARPAPRIEPTLDPELTSRPLIDALLAGRFTAHGETHQIGDPVGWLTNPSEDIEWHIVLHKFGHAPGLVQAFIDTGDLAYLDLWKSHTLSWIAHVSPGYIAADVTGRRIRNWVYALALFNACGDPPADPFFIQAVYLSIAEQADWLKRNLHAARNHRTLELFAILLAAILLEDPREARFALDALADNAEADFLPDGVHVELSSHYHCLALRSMVEATVLAAANDIPIPDRLTSAIARARRFASALHKPDGTIPALSDADVGDYRNLLGATPRPGRVEIFPNGGYVFLRDEAAVRGDRYGAYLVLDCGDIGAGNHGHLDCLSIEFAACGRSLIVDPGRFTYFEGGQLNERARFRGTAAHNLVQVDGREQTRYRHGPKRKKIAGPAPSAQLIAARSDFAHAQARSAQYSVTIERRIVAGACGWWLVHDTMTAASPHDYDCRFQLSPEAEGRAQIVTLADGTPAISSPNLIVIPLASDELALALEPSFVAPRYGERLAAPLICARQHAATAWFATLLVAFTDTPPDPRFAVEGTGFRISLDGGATSDWIGL